MFSGLWWSVVICGDLYATVASFGKNLQLCSILDTQFHAVPALAVALALVIVAIVLGQHKLFVGIHRQDHTFLTFPSKHNRASFGDMWVVAHRHREMIHFDHPKIQRPLFAATRRRQSTIQDVTLLQKSLGHGAGAGAGAGDGADDRQEG